MPMPLFPFADVPICNYLLMYITAFYITGHDHEDSVPNLNTEEYEVSLINCDTYHSLSANVMQKFLNNRLIITDLVKKFPAV
jgi:hypothetical protein